MSRPSDHPTLSTRPRTKSALLRLAIPFAVVASCLALAGCPPPQAVKDKDKQGRWGKGPNQGEVKAEKAFLAPVIVQKVSRGPLESTVATTGSAVPIRTRMLRSEEAGRLVFTKAWKEGDPVTEGEEIARIVSENLDNELRLAEADVEIAEEQLAIGKRSMDSSIREFRTLQDLYARGIAAGKEVDRTELEMQRAINSQKQNEINLEKAKSRLANLKVRRERLSIRAPFAGLIVAKSTLEGQAGFTRSFGKETITDWDGRMVGAELAICGVVDCTQMLMRSDVTSKDISRIRPGQKARVIYYATEDFVVEGTVQSIAGAINPETRAFAVDIILENPEGLVKPGMFGRLETIVETRLDTVSVPKSVISRRNNRDVVFVAERRNETGNDVAVERAVELGLEGRENIEITYGLREGDRLVIRGFEVLQNNTPVASTDIDAPTTGTLERKPEDKTPVLASGGV